MVMDREGKPISKKCIGITTWSLLCNSSLYKISVFKSFLFEIFYVSVMIVRSISESKCFDSFLGEFSLLCEVLLSTTPLKAIFKNTLQTFVEELIFFLGISFLLRFFWIVRVFTNIGIGHLCQLLHAIPKFQSFNFHMKGDRISSLSASKTLKYLFLIRYGEAWSFFLMEWTESCPVISHFFEINIFFYKIDNIDAFEYLFTQWWHEWLVMK